MKTFREQIKEKMEKKEINTPELARRAGLNAQTVYNYLSGKCEMKANNLETLLGILK